MPFKHYLLKVTQYFINSLFYPIGKKEKKSVKKKFNTGNNYLCKFITQNFIC